MKIALCAIGRLENQYALEFVEYYKSIGFDKIFIYDNNHDGEEHFEDVLSEHIGNGLVDIINIRNIEAAQLPAYNDCYKKHGNEYDWIAFFDFDEFLTLKKDKNVKNFLSKFNDYDCVKINWMVYDDNNLIKNNKKPLLERFTHPMEYDKCITYQFPENNHVKSIIKGGINNFIWKGNSHVPGMSIKTCNAEGKESDTSPFQPYSFETAYIKHFTTKTIDEWINNKLIRGIADRTKESFEKICDIERFFKYNKKTKTKVNFINKKTETKRKDNIDIFIFTYKDFIPYVKDTAYKTINTRNIDDKSLPLKDDFYSELYGFKYVCDNIPLKKYVGTCHYRKYFSFLDDIPDMNEIFKNYDCIVSKPIIYKNSTVKSAYASCHNVEDLEIVEEIIKKKFTSYYESFENLLNGKIFVPYNMFIMKKSYFKKYCKFIFSILDEYLKVVGTDIKKRIENNSDKYFKHDKNYPQNDTVEYQYRIGGYLAERLTNVFLMKHFKKMMIKNVIITEEKYK